MTSSLTPNEALLAEYTLGLLSPRELQQAHALLAQEDDAVASALGWEERLLALTDLLMPVDPSPLVLQRIQTSLGHDTTPPPSALYRRPEGAAERPAPPIEASSKAAITPWTEAPDTGTGAAPGAAPDRETAAAHGATHLTRAAATPRVAPRKEPIIAPPASRNGDSIARPRAAVRTEPTGAPPVAPRREPLFAAPPEAVTTPAPGDHAEPATRKPENRPLRGRSGKTGGNIWYWRLSTLAFAGISLIMGLAPAKPTAPPVTVLEVAPTQAAILQAPGQSSTPAWVVTIDHQQNVHMTPQVSTDVPPNASVQLWTYTGSMPQPRSLGIIDPNRPVTVPAELLGGVSPGQIFEMTLEAQGGARSPDPAGPILYIGRVVTLGAAPPATAPPSAGEALSTPSR